MLTALRCISACREGVAYYGYTEHMATHKHLHTHTKKHNIAILTVWKICEQYEVTWD